MPFFGMLPSMPHRRTFLTFLLFAIATGAHAQRDPLPKVVLVGDSIRLSYAPLVIRELNGQATVISPKGNGGDSANVLRKLASWVIAAKPDIVHFNCGIHDTKLFTAGNEFQVPPTQYEANLRRIVERIRAETDAIVLFATTTPILDDRAAAKRKGRDYVLTGEAVWKYNTLARKVMTELNVPINDLHRIVTYPPKPHKFKSLIGDDGVHLTQSAKELLGKAVAKFIQRHLKK